MYSTKDIPKRPQRQDSTEEQLRDLSYVADKLGMYDASDSIRRQLNSDKVYALPYDMAKKVAEDMANGREIGPETLKRFGLAFKDLADAWEKYCETVKK